MTVISFITLKKFLFFFNLNIYCKIISTQCDVKRGEDLSEQLIRTGDKKAFEMFYRTHFKSLIAYLRMFVKEPEQAKDLAQQSFAKLWIKRTAVPGHVPLKKYLFGIAKNHFIDKLRAKEREEKALEMLKIEALTHYHNDDNQEIARKSELLNQAIEILPPKCQEILLLSKREGLTYKQIASQLNISVKTVESQMRIAYAKIRISLEEIK